MRRPILRHLLYPRFQALQRRYSRRSSHTTEDYPGTDPTCCHRVVHTGRLRRKTQWVPNLEAARLVGAELEKVVAEAEMEQEDEGKAVAMPA